jgi:DNA glycosylase AlkZ-like
MAHPLSEDQVLMLRLRAQRLAPQSRPTAGAAQVVRDLCGVQAQDAAAAALAVRARCAGLIAADVERSLVQERSVVRTWCMRGTLHLVAAEDLGWLLAYLGPVFIRATRGRRAELGLDDETAGRVVRALRELLAQSGPLAREEIVERLAARGIRLAGQARPHLLGLAALEGIICTGPARNREPTYVLISDWIDLGPALPPEEARARLAVRYLSAYAPAAPEDFAAWSGLSLGESRSAWRQIASQLIEVEIGDARAWMLRTQASGLDDSPASPPVVRLLPAFDTYLLGYHSREAVLAPEHAKRIFPGGGILRPTLLVDGRGRGAWRVKRRRGGIDVVVEPFQELTADVRRGLEAEVLDLGHFLGATASLRA